MDAVAFNDPAVIRFISSEVVPLRLAADDPQWATYYSIRWTPSLLLLDAAGREQSRHLGFVAPQELIPMLLLGIGRAAFSHGQRSEANTALARVTTDYPHSFSTPEAIYLQGVCAFLADHDPTCLTALYDRLMACDPQGEWAMRAAPYRLLRQARPADNGLQSGVTPH